MVKTTDELLNSIKDIIGDNNSDKAIAILEDTSDTLNDMAKQVRESGDWKSKYEENDASWRKKYRDRFFEPSAEPDDDEGVEPVKKQLTYESLFKEG